MVKRKGRGVQKRKSARILALATLKKAKKQKNNEDNNPSTSFQQQQTREVAAEEHNAPPPPPPPPPAMEASSSRQPLPGPRRGRKKKRLDEVAVTSVGPTTHQNGENPKHEVLPVNSAVLPSTMPEKHILEFILDILQRRDTHEIFAQPVDPNEVEGYDSIIKKPMDFGTMRAKLQEGMYLSLEQFEGDVFLILSNAMLFNSSATIYFRQARAIHELAKRVFHTLKTNPNEIELEFSLTIKRGRKSQPEARGSRVKLGAKLRGNNLACRGSSGTNPRDNEILPGSERRQTYSAQTSVVSEKESIVSTVSSSSKQLVPGNGGIGYRESLLRFVKDLVPTAQEVANQKLRSSCLISSSAAPQRPSCMDVVINGVTANANNPLGNHGAISRGKNILTSESIDIDSSACGGKMALGVGRLGIQSAASKGKSILTNDSMDSYGGACRGKTALLGRVDFQGLSSKETLPRNDITGIHSAIQGEREGIDRTLNRQTAADIGPSRGSDKKDHLARALGEDTALLGETIKSWSGLDLPTDENEGLKSTPATITDASSKYMDLLQGGISGDIAHRSQDTKNQWCSYLPSAGTSNINSRPKYTAMDRMMGYRQFSDEVQPAQLASRSQPGLLEFLSSDNSHPKSSVYPSKVIKPAGSSLASSTLLHGLGNESSAPLDLNYGASSSQASQPLEWIRSNPWAPQEFYDGFMQQEPQLTMAQYLQPQPSGLNSLDQDAMLRQDLQLALAQSMQPQQPNEATIFGQDALSQQGLMQFSSTPYVQPQPSLLNLLDQDAYVQQGSQLEFSQFLQPQPSDVNPLGRDGALPRETQLGLAQQGLMSGAGNFGERAPLQGHQPNSNAQLWNYQQQAMRGSQHPDLALRLQTQNRRL